VTPFDDFLVESSETVVVTLVTNAAYLINASSNTATVTILDNDVQFLVVSTNQVSVLEGSTNSFTVRLNAQPTNNLTVTTIRSSGDTDLSVTNGATLTFTSNNWNVEQAVVLADAEDPDAVNGQATFTVASAGLTNQTITATEVENDVQSIIVSTNSVIVPEGST